MTRIAANLTMLYTEYDFFDRSAVAAEDGLNAVEFFFPYRWPAEKLIRTLEKNPQQLLLSITPSGVWDSVACGLVGQVGRSRTSSV